MGTSYTRSELKALKNGFKEIDNPEANNGRYFVKNGLTWIHDIDRLKNHIKITHQLDSEPSDAYLKSLNYDVDSYYLYNND